RCLKIGILEDAEILPRAHDCEEALDSTAPLLAQFLDFFEILGGLLQVLPGDRSDPEEPDIGEHASPHYLGASLRAPSRVECLSRRRQPHPRALGTDCSKVRLTAGCDFHPVVETQRSGAGAIPS